MKDWQRNERDLALKALNSAAGQFGGEKAVSNFIDKVLTDGERIDIGRRIAVARMILEGNTYFEIHSKLSISPNTFRNIRQWVHEELPNYNDVLESNRKLSEKRALKKQKKSFHRTQPFSFQDLKKRYPMHFLLFNLFDELIANSSGKPSSQKRSPRKRK